MAGSSYAFFLPKIILCSLKPYTCGAKFYTHALSLSDVIFIMLINVKMTTIVGILTFMSTINFELGSVEHE